MMFTELESVLRRRSIPSRDEAGRRYLLQVLNCIPKNSNSWFHQYLQTPFECKNHLFRSLTKCIHCTCWFRAFLNGSCQDYMTHEWSLKFWVVTSWILSQVSYHWKWAEVVHTPAVPPSSQYIRYHICMNFSSILGIKHSHQGALQLRVYYPFRRHSGFDIASFRIAFRKMEESLAISMSWILSYYRRLRWQMTCEGNWS